jgi:hypothetical protein
MSTITQKYSRSQAECLKLRAQSILRSSPLMTVDAALEQAKAVLFGADKYAALREHIALCAAQS